MFSSKVEEYDYKNDYIQGDTIWVCWWQGEENMPPIVKACYRSILRNKSSYKVCLLDKWNFKNFVDIPEYILEKLKKGLISITHFSDILRFSLLSEYGGWWLDATIYLTHPIDVKKSFYTIKQPSDLRFISEALWSGFVWYMPSEHPLALFVRDCLYEYWAKNDALITYLLIDHIIKVYYMKKIQFKNEIQKLKCESPDLYFFQSCYSLELYDRMKWRSLCCSNKFFKCNWKMQVNDINNHSFFAIILNDNL